MLRRRAAHAVLATGLGTAAWLALASSAHAQVPDLASVSVGYLPAVVIDGKAPARVGMRSYDAVLNAPISAGRSLFFIPGASYHLDSLSYSGTSDDFPDLHHLQAVDMSLLAVQLLRDDWSVSARIAPGLAGDFKDVDGDSFRLTAMALVSRRFSPRFSLGGGALVSYRFGGVLPLPAVNLDWRPTEAVQVSAFVPVFAQVRWTIADRVQLGVRADFVGNGYAITDERIAGTWPCQAAANDLPGSPEDESRARPEACLHHVTYTAGSAGLTAGVRLFSTVWLHAMGGHTFLRWVDRSNADGDTITGRIDDLPNVPFAKLALTWRLPERRETRGSRGEEDTASQAFGRSF
jgi:hypothetical protein